MSSDSGFYLIRDDGTLEEIGIGSVVSSEPMAHYVVSEFSNGQFVFIDETYTVTYQQARQARMVLNHILGISNAAITRRTVQVATRKYRARRKRK